MNSDEVREIEYQVFDEDGNIVDETDPSEPMVVDPEDEEILPAVVEAVFKMEIGEEVKLVLGPEEAFGDRDPEAIVDMPLEDFPEGVPEVGEIFTVDDDEEGELNFSIISVQEDSVTADFNHPLAGRTLTVKIRRVA